MFKKAFGKGLGFSEPALALAQSGKVIVPHLEIAETLLARGKGLLGRSGIEQGTGMLITPCWSIHMFFLKFAIDAVFVDNGGCILKIAESLAPWKTASFFGASAVVELPEGSAAEAGLEQGVLLKVVETDIGG